MRFYDSLKGLKNQEDWSGRKKRFTIRFVRMQFVAGAFLLILAVLLLSHRNVSYETQERMIRLLGEDKPLSTPVEQEAECLLLWEEGDPVAAQGRKEMEPILSQMRVGFQLCECRDFQKEKLEGCEKVVLSITHLDLLGEGLLDILDWVRQGGGLMILHPPENNGMLQFIASDLGITMLGSSMAWVDGLHFSDDFLIGGGAHDFMVTDPYESSLAVSLAPDCLVYAESTGENPTPIVWKHTLGQGDVVVDNLGFLEKAYRGIHSSAYSLLGGSFAWPVINASVFYIDDFPSPVPAGEGKYITRDYGMDIENFYTMVWWENVRSFAKLYGVRYTGLVIEQYSDQVKAPYERNNDATRYQYFGNMLLDTGGEIGFHGYNHMPLCLKNFDYRGDYDAYRRWESYEDMKAGFKELTQFCGSLFPDEEFHTYVPPSNILSEEGRRMLHDEFPEIKAIASVYLEGDLAYSQEFCVAEDGIVETPRVISGYIMDDYTKLTALAELNFHFVSSHFQHPDDVLDEDRGAAMGWPQMFSNISEYMKWLYSSAHDIRNLTGVEMAGAVQRYDALTLQQEETEDALKLTLGGFADEAWLLVRINQGRPGRVAGGTLTKQVDGLYLLKADQPEITIELIH